ncbi:Endonuclease III-like protein [Psilocybe cubensis]|uniref:Endonuclease III homolog n=2 Tax=Psilocybe cubensis TaxID=181762 RepID=A0A8H7Y4G6_PSICU|nr:Endonuclease III-like protein [Psilocybe cubensis]KAH9483573.1 Endonuclease III-like protein [Psilocybe cubensis]
MHTPSNVLISLVSVRCRQEEQSRLARIFQPHCFFSLGFRTMSSSKRTASNRLTSRVSQFDPQVTLLEISGPQDSPRRSKRIKTEIKAEVKTESLVDLEDLNLVKLDPESETDTPKKRKRATPTKVVRPSLQDAAQSSNPTPQKKPATNVTSPKKGKTKAIPQELGTPHPAPPKWRETYDTIKEMRSRFVAPVDTMGCQQAQVAETDPKNRRYATLVSLMLSSQTKDEVTNAAVDNLRKAFGGSISVDAMIAADDSVISEAIAKVGFWRRKTTYLKQAAIRLRDDFDSDVPSSVDELCSLPGVGPKMAFLALQIAWNQYDGIGVDVHVHRITNLLGWHKPPTTTPEQTRLNLQSWLPKELFGDINHMLVGFGQVVCLPVGPRCDMCDLSAKGLCPSARTVTTKNRKEIIFTNVTKVQDSPPKVEIKLEEETEEMKYVPPRPSEELELKQETEDEKPILHEPPKVDANLEKKPRKELYVPPPPPPPAQS